MKRTILVAVLLISCILSVTVSGTIAWFTDTVTTANNSIEAGNLDIEVYKNEVADANKIENKEVKIFDLPERWEPAQWLRQS